MIPFHHLTTFPNEDLSNKSKQLQKQKILKFILACTLAIEQNFVKELHHQNVTSM